MSDILLPSEGVTKEFREFVYDMHRKKMFPCFATTEQFFQYYFNTNLRLNDFKNLTSHMSGTGRFANEYFKYEGFANNVNYYSLN